MPIKSVSICPNPIFVVGCPRSGTSVLAHSLARHSQMWLGPESDYIAPLACLAKELYTFGTQRGERHWLSNQGVTLDEFLEYIGLGINALYTNRSGGLRWIEQTPAYTLNLYDLSKMFPGAHFIHIVRDGRDVVNSMLHSGFPWKWASDFQVACKTWVGFVKAALEFEDTNPTRILKVYHELLITNSSKKLKKILDFLNLPYEEATTELYKSRKIINSSFKNESERERLKWQNSWSLEQKVIFASICGSLLVKLEYEKDNSWVSS